ncbi:MAG: cobalamin-binding protein [Tepidanaerobacteraceae bacterium]|jgi:iron complex transport system substrate-binding protein|nr:cobalamin-binding protein [Tepidanaerobacteraceae bacterium]
MKRTIIEHLSLLLILFIIIGIFTGCNSSKVNKGKTSENPAAPRDNVLHQESAAFPLKVKDQMNRQVIMGKEPQRIVSLAPSNTEILFALGLGEKVVGVTNYCDYPEEAKSKEKIGGFSDPNLEKIVSLKPDLVVATDMHQDIVEQMEKLNIPAVVLVPKNIPDMLNSIKILGMISGKESESLRLIKALENRIKAVEDKVVDIPKEKLPKVYYEVWPEPFTTAGPGTFVNDIIQSAGGQNIAGDAEKAYPQYSQEMIISKNPDIIIFSHHGSSKQTVEDILKRPGWENISAVKDKKVFYVDENIMQRATPRLIDGLEQIAKIIHPELFE